MIKPRRCAEAFLWATRGNWTVYGDKRKASDGITISGMAAGPCMDLAWILQSISIIRSKCCKAVKKLSYSIMTTYVRSSWSWLCGRQLACGDPAHFPCLRDVSGTVVNSDMKRYKDKISGLLWEFEKRFQVFGELETEFAVFCSPFTVKPSDVPVAVQLEIIDLQCNTNLPQWTWTHVISISCQGTPN